LHQLLPKLGQGVDWLKDLPIERITGAYFRVRKNLQAIKGEARAQRTGATAGLSVLANAAPDIGKNETAAAVTFNDEVLIHIRDVDTSRAIVDDHTASDAPHGDSAGPIFDCYIAAGPDHLDRTRAVFDGDGTANVA
jgi:hypothetical protein